MSRMFQCFLIISNTLIENFLPEVYLTIMRLKKQKSKKLLLISLYNKFQYLLFALYCFSNKGVYFEQVKFFHFSQYYFST